ncbi:MAG TPA: GMC family oxidoreductase [Polyangiaceae bacterium]|jgi:cholesterol oxidase|nr:GMC family oxidoreductase [Polyangiaceae bacterium]
METPGNQYDWIVIGSGFGGSVSALRLAEKGYRVLVIEKGRRFAATDFAKTNMELSRWLWAPGAGLRGIYQMTFMRHVTILHGVGVGGGSLVYANTLPRPKRPFYESKSWAHLGDWERELAPHYDTALQMLGATRYPGETEADRILKQIAVDIGRPEHHHPTDVAVFFGKAGVEVDDPYFGGKGPKRVGCTECGACMTGCRVGAKNTLDKNYLYLAERLGVEVLPETEVQAVRKEPGGYRVETRGSLGKKQKRVFQAEHVVFAGGVMGTIPLLLAMREDPNGLPQLSARVGRSVRTNNESLTAVSNQKTMEDFSRGVAITSILHTDDDSHVEPVRYGDGSNFFRRLVFPHSTKTTLLGRLGAVAKAYARHPLEWARMFVAGENRKTAILLYMRTLDESLTLTLKKLPFGGRALNTEIDDPSSAPRANLPEAADLAERFAEKMGGVVSSLFSESLMGTPTTAHILGGACMGKDASDGVIDAEHRVFGYPGLYVIDGSAVSANPGVNPSLTITALAERAMSRIPVAAEVGRTTEPRGPSALASSSPS